MVELLLHAGATLGRTALSIAVALIFALPAAVLIGRHARLDALTRPLLYLLYTVPKVALFPLALLLFGLNDIARVSIVSLVLFFQFLLSLRDGVRELPDPFFLAMSSLGAGRIDRLRYLIMPALLPRLFTSLRIGAAAALSVLFFTETSAVRGYGLGRMTIQAWMSLQYGKMILAAGTTALLGVMLFLMFRGMEKRFCPV